MQQTDGERIAVLEKQMQIQENYNKELKVELIEKMDEGFSGIKESIEKMVKSNEDRFCKIENSISGRIKESDENQRKLSEKTDKAKEELEKKIGEIKDELTSTKGMFKGISTVLTILWAIITFIVPLIKGN